MAAFQRDTGDGTIARTLAALMAVGFLALVLAGFATLRMVDRYQEHARWVAHTYQVENTVFDTRRLIEQSEAARRGYVLAPKTAAFLANYREAAVEVPSRVAALGRLTADNPVQRAAMARLRSQLAALFRVREATVALIARGDPAGARAAFDDAAEAARMRAIRTTFDSMAAEERRLLSIRERDLNAAIRNFYIVLAGAGVLLGVLALVALLTVVAYTRDLSRSHSEVRALNAGLEARVSERTADLTRANEEIQRFAYIVSHDLRSPLVNVMGFTAELEAASAQVRALVDRADATAPGLVTPDDRLAVAEDLPEAIGFIRTSTQKMDRLINAILALSRQGRRVLSPEPVDMGAMVAQIGETIAHRLDEAGATLSVDGTLPVIVTDRLSVDQVMSNLIDNAVKYLKPGVPGRITVSGWRDEAKAVFAIADNGRGIDPRDHDRVFDLFRRSGAQDQPGEGIGLATVRAIVFRLGGHIEVDSTLGEGATFRLTLPLTLEPQEKRA